MNNFKAEAITAIMRRRLYAKGMRRTPLFKAITGVLAVNMTFMGMAPVALAGNLPEMTSGYGPGMTVDGNKLTIDSTAGSSFTWDQGFNIGQGYSVEFNGISVAVNKANYTHDMVMKTKVWKMAQLRLSHSTVWPLRKAS